MIAWLLALAITQDPEALRAGERAFAAGQFEDAARHYQAALAEPALPAGPILINLARCCRQLQRPAEAVWHLQRALARAPRDGELLRELAAAEAACGLDDRQPRPAWLASLTGSQLLWTGAVLQGLGLLLVVLRRGHTRQAGVLLTAGGFATLTLLATRLWAGAPDLAIVLADRVEVLQEPRHGAPIALPLHAGEAVAITGALDGEFIAVTHARGQGFLRRSDLGIVD